MIDPLALVESSLPTGSPAIVLVDGRSGSGKTTLARQIADLWRGSVLLRLDDVYPGWDGLRAGSDHVIGSVLEPLRSGRQGTWTAWDWSADAAGQVHQVEVGSRLVVEGCGALSVRSLAAADLAVWIELDAVSRKTRALARDGDTYASNWRRWADQEDAFIASENPRELADLVIDGHTIAG